MQVVRGSSQLLLHSPHRPRRHRHVSGRHGGSVSASVTPGTGWVSARRARWRLGAPARHGATPLARPFAPTPRCPAPQAPRRAHLLVNGVEELHLGLQTRRRQARAAAAPLAGRVRVAPAVVAAARPQGGFFQRATSRCGEQRAPDTWRPGAGRLVAAHSRPGRALGTARLSYPRALGCALARASRRAGRHTLPCERQQRGARSRHGALGRGVTVSRETWRLPRSILHSQLTLLPRARQQ